MGGSLFRPHPSSHFLRASSIDRCFQGSNNYIPEIDKRRRINIIIWQKNPPSYFARTKLRVEGPLCSISVHTFFQPLSVVRCKEDNYANIVTERLFETDTRLNLWSKKRQHHALFKYFLSIFMCCAIQLCTNRCVYNLYLYTQAAKMFLQCFGSLPYKIYKFWYSCNGIFPSFLLQWT